MPRVSPHALPRIVGLALPPFAHQLVEIGIALFRQHDAYGGEKIALAVPAWKASALEAERASRIGAGGDCKLDRSVKGRHPHLGPEHRLVECDWELEPQVGALTRKQRMRRDRYRDQEIAGATAGTGYA